MCGCSMDDELECKNAVIGDTVEGGHNEYVIRTLNAQMTRFNSCQISNVHHLGKLHPLIRISNILRYFLALKILLL